MSIHLLYLSLDSAKRGPACLAALASLRGSANKEPNTSRIELVTCRSCAAFLRKHPQYGNYLKAKTEGKEAGTLTPEAQNQEAHKQARGAFPRKGQEAPNRKG